MQACDSFAYVTSCSTPPPAGPHSKSRGQIKLLSTTSYNQIRAILYVRVWPRIPHLYAALDPSNKNGALLREGHFTGGPRHGAFVGLDGRDAGELLIFCLQQPTSKALEGLAKSVFSAHCSSAYLPEPLWPCLLVLKPCPTQTWGSVTKQGTCKETLIGHTRPCPSVLLMLVDWVAA